MDKEKISAILDKLIYFLALLMGIFQIYNSIFRSLDPIRLQNFHLMFALVLIFLGSTKGMLSAEKKLWRVAFPLLGLAAALLTTLYIHICYDDMILRVGRSTTVDLVIGAILLAVILYATSESFGKVIPILIIIGIIYMFAGPYLPGIFYHGGFSIKRVIASLVTSFSGCFGNLLNTSATYIALFMILGGVMNRAI